MRRAQMLAAAILLALMASTSVSNGTTPEQTGNAEPAVDPARARWSIYSERREEKAGERTAKQLDKPGNLMQDPVVLEYVNRVARRVLATSASDRSVQVKVLMSPAFNAFSIPGGTIYITVGLLKGLDSEDELASVLGHEIGHVTARHWANQQSKRVLLRTGGYVVAAFVPFGGAVVLGYDRATPHVLSAFSRQEEQEADALGLKYSYRAGYDPSAFVSFLQKAVKIEKDDPEKKQKNTQDYPETSSRIAKAEQQIASFPLKHVPTAAAAKEFAAIQERLPEFEAAKTTRLVFANRRPVPPSIVNPTEIKNFMLDETPPVLKWKNPSTADDDSN